MAQWSALIGLLTAILTDQFVLFVDLEGGSPGFEGVLDLREPDALLEQLTGRSAPLRIRLRSWGGTADRELTAGDLRL